ncbi:MAG TPA: nitrous oxide reductase family maturation protein NosD [Gemmatimonadales bacterium]|nr:nitrous oxide reductase family maturation protein NosD [Gemmatimonadales bacterium]
MIPVLVVALLWGPVRRPIEVRPGSAVATLTAALRQAQAGDTIIVHAGTYREPPIIVDRSVTILGEGRPVFDGGGAHEIVEIRADDVTLHGLVLQNVGVSYTEDRAAIRIDGARRCRVEDNELDNAFFGIYAARVDGCRIAGNVVRGTGQRQSGNANAIHLYSTRNVVVLHNTVSGHRDGIYLEFSRHARIEGNQSSANTRYGLHFMFSDSCDYRDNDFRDNVSGVAVMYSHAVTMVDNAFSGSHGPASYGLLLKELRDSRLIGNRFRDNTVGLYIEGTDRLTAADNEFVDCGWGIKLMANADDDSFEHNRFTGNSFDVTTNSRATRARFHGNYWDRYTGYDLDRDGYGDVPFRPVRLFGLAVEQHPAALLLARSFFMDLLDTAERVLPILTPEALSDDRPLMRWPR